jgi:hypothetical protein
MSVVGTSYLLNVICSKRKRLRAVNSAKQSGATPMRPAMAAGGTSSEIKIIKAICLTWKVDRRRQVIYARAACRSQNALPPHTGTYPPVGVVGEVGDSPSALLPKQGQQLADCKKGTREG